jgi:hypothetical protein
MINLFTSTFGVHEAQVAAEPVEAGASTYVKRVADPLSNHHSNNEKVW